MPVFDVSCACGWERADVFEHHGQPSPCGACGKPTTHVWRSSMSAGVIPDEYTKPWVSENLGHEPVTIYSRSQLKREMDARGLRPFVRHVGEPGSDKSSRTSRWV
jgi:hypothetical protein